MRYCRVLRVFTREGRGGNLLGVVTDLAGLDGSSMQGVAASLGYSETVFIDRGPAVPVVRIFTPAAEIPFAGHPLVGAGWALAGLGGGRRLRCGLGEIPFRADAAGAWIEVSLPSGVEVTAAVPPAGLPAPTRAWVVRLPLRYLLLEVDDAATVSEVETDFGRLAAAPWEGTMVFARAGRQVKARFFAPALGVAEDPATGSAAVALAAALAHAGEREGSLSIEQGDEVGAPSLISVCWSGGVATLGGAVDEDPVRLLGP